MILDHKTSHKFRFLEIDIYTSSESWVNKLSIDVWVNLESEVQNNRTQYRNIEKIAFKVVQMKFLAIHITKQTLSLDILMVGNVLNIFMDHDLY